uniref:Uncharacterized protein n=1 Tax=Oryza meridionalis TaxID=40149 RepID=A0A0E0DVG7_9ORYZ
MATCSRKEGTRINNREEALHVLAPLDAAAETTERLVIDSTRPPYTIAFRMSQSSLCSGAGVSINGMLASGPICTDECSGRVCDSTASGGITMPRLGLSTIGLTTSASHICNATINICKAGSSIMVSCISRLWKRNVLLQYDVLLPNHHMPA